MDKIKVGVIGVGHLGHNHARIFNELNNVELVGVVDTESKLAKKIARANKTKSYTKYKDLLGKIDAVSIAVPTKNHFEIGKFFLENNIHSLIEKPITSSVEQAQKLVDIARKKKTILQVGHIERFNTAVIKMKTIVTEPKFIESHRLGSYDPRVKDIGVILDNMIHDLDIILQLVNSKIKSIEAVGVAVFSKWEDLANARIKFENGCIANITASRIYPEKMRKIRIFQPDAYISLNYINQEMEVYRKKPLKKRRKDGITIAIERRKVRVKKEEPLKLELQHFIDCVRKGNEPMVTGEHARDALELALEITELVRKGQYVV